MNELEDIFQKIGNILNDKISDKWDEIKVFTFIDSPDSTLTWSKYLPAGENVYKDFDLEYEIIPLFENIRQILTKDHPSTPWLKMKYTLHSDLKFSFDFKYFPDDPQILELEHHKCHELPDEL